MRSVILLFLSFFLCSCSYFEKKKIDSQSILEQELKTFSWNEVDQFPSFESCEDIINFNENKICFIVELTAKKPEIAEAVTTLYNQKVIKVNTARTIYGKKAFVKFENTEKARDLATKIGML